ncbi:hypothetical protein RI103_38775 (plasmid) [Paraburkholderia sp. FT54]|uniref:hypothetical protein n=1 Tax=Paraburkholderia sp. FT54 TaxID=3074437 RepID=UPI002877B6FD|nr:hypothetical protein [Paraburkholderia sp. FT54]WNC95232.1 hypothetical protein RI103_38775 [Paraburkholderia sp. FT54]
MGQAKGLEISYHGQTIRGSLAMAHVLATLQHSNPTRIVAILPESVMFSELDKPGRAILDALYHVEIEEQFKNSTFRGARVNSVLVAMDRLKTPRIKSLSSNAETLHSKIKIIRGGLPCFEATETRKGLHFVHSTDIRRLVHGYPLSKLIKVSPFSRGVTSGHMVLLPRVGIPKEESIDAWYSERPIQLSDCVLALQFASADAAEEGADSMRQNYQSLAQLYRGTGARYVTLERLSTWIDASGIK